MPIIAAEDAPTFEMHGVRFTGLAAPSRGATENSVWVVAVQPGTTAVPHRVTREETFVAIAGAARVVLDGAESRLAAGSALVVPAGVEFALDNPYAESFRAVVVLPVGGQAAVAGAPPFTPPWAV